MPSDLINTRGSEVRLSELKLRAGMLLQLQPAANPSVTVEAQFLAALDRKGVMTTPHDTRHAMTPGEEYSIRGFTGQYDFLFSSRVIQNFKVPFAYTLLEYPETVKARLVRKAMRMKTQLPAAALPHGHKAPSPATLIDLSIAGAMILSSKAMGTTGDPLHLAFSLEIEKDRMNLQLAAKIAHCAETSDGFRTGLMFENLAQSDRMALHYYMTSLPE